MAAKKTPYAGGAKARYWLLGSAFGLTAAGLIMVYSASSISAAVADEGSGHYLLRQLLFIVIGSAVAWWLGRYDYRRLKGQSPWLWVAGIVLLLATLVIGAVRGGARRWIPLGLFNLQPSELAKIACVLLVAAMAVEWSRGRLSGRRFAVYTLIATAVPAALIMLQPDLGTTATLIVAVVLVLVLAGMNLWLLAAATGAVGVIGGLLIWVEPYRLQRVTGFLNPWADPQGTGWQTIQAMLAFGTGGLSGVGLGLSRQKFTYLPEAHTDFILAIIGEEAGLIGTLAVVVGFVIFVWAGFRIASGARDGFGRLVAGGLTGMLGFQAIINMGGVTGIMPITGKPLPFVSYGGSSMLVTMMCLGLLLSVSRYGALAPRAVRRRVGNEGSQRASVHERRGDRRSHPSGVERRGTHRRRA